RGQPFYMICLVFFVALYTIGWVGFQRTQGSELHHPMEWGIDLGVGGTLLSLALFEAARGRFGVRQPAWALVPLLSLTFLAFAPFLWVALSRRRARDWAVLAARAAGARPGGGAIDVGPGREREGRVRRDGTGTPRADAAAGLLRRRGPRGGLAGVIRL